MKRLFSAIISLFTPFRSKKIGVENEKETRSLSSGEGLGKEGAKTIRQEDIAHLPQKFQQLIKQNGMGSFTEHGKTIEYFRYKD